MTDQNNSGMRKGPITKFTGGRGGGTVGRVHMESGVSYDVPEEHVTEEEFQLAQDLWVHDRHVYARVAGDPREDVYVVGLEVEEIVPLDIDKHSQEELPFTP